MVVNGSHCGRVTLTAVSVIPLRLAYRRMGYQLEVIFRGDRLLAARAVERPSGRHLQRPSSRERLLGRRDYSGAVRRHHDSSQPLSESRHHLSRSVGRDRESLETRIAFGISLIGGAFHN